MIRGGHQRSEFLQCKCAEKGNFQGSLVVWSNGHGECLRYWCPSDCGHFVDVECMRKTNYEPRIVQAAYTKKRCSDCGKYFTADLMERVVNDNNPDHIRWICETCQE